MTAYIKANEAAAELGITTTSLYKIGNHTDPAKKLEPINRNTYNGDGGFVYRREDLDRIKPSYVKKDLASSEAAKKIGRSPTYLHKILREKKLPYYEGELHGKRTFFIKEVDLQAFISSNPDTGKHDIIFDRKTGVFLFQSFKFGDRFARVVSLKRVNQRKKEILLQVGNERISYEKAISIGWAPVSKKPITSSGYHGLNFRVRPLSTRLFMKLLKSWLRRLDRQTFGFHKRRKLL